MRPRLLFAMTITLSETSSFKKFCIVLTGLVLLAACAPALPPADPERAQNLRNEALKYNLKNDYISAAELYQEATLYEPLNSSAYLNLADLQETLGDPSGAVKTYNQALRYLPESDQTREFISYRAALLLAAKLDKPGKAKKSLNKLSNPALKNDLNGVIEMYQDAPAEALKYFSDALKSETERDQYARIYFHIAQAYDLLGDEDSSRDALLTAVEKASSRPLKEDIRHFFETLLKRPKL